MVARAQAFAASARDLRPLVLLTVGDYDGVTGHVLTAADPRADKVVLNLAQAVAARAEPVQGIPDLTPDPGGRRAAGEPAGRARPGHRRRAPTRRRPPGGWRWRSAPSAPARTTRPPGWPRWSAGPGTASAAGCWPGTRRRLGAASPVHHAADMDSVVVSLLAGGSGRGEVRQRLNQVAAALPGFDVGVRVRIVTPVAPRPPVRPPPRCSARSRCGRSGSSPPRPGRTCRPRARRAAARRRARCSPRSPLRRRTRSGPGCGAASSRSPGGLSRRDRARPAAGGASPARPGAAVPVAGHRVPGRSRAAHRAGGAARRGRVRRVRHRAAGRAARDARPGDRAAARRRRRVRRAGAPVRRRPAPGAARRGPARHRQVGADPAGLRLELPGAGAPVRPARPPGRAEHADRVRVEGRRRAPGSTGAGRGPPGTGRC